MDDFFAENLTWVRAAKRGVGKRCFVSLVWKYMENRAGDSNGIQDFDRGR